jgi:hypothetical protein
LLLLLATTSSALATVRYVNVNCANPTPPYTNWVTAATDIQSAVDAAAAGDQVVVTNGIYIGGSGLDPYGEPTCVVVAKPLTVQSVNGPDATIIEGGGGARCLYLTDDAVMLGFTLTYGENYDIGGGGVFCESTHGVLTNCVLSVNEAHFGGGAYGGTLNNCTLTGNTGWECGGGAYDCTLNNCTLTGNSAQFGGGAGCCMLNHCALTVNSYYVMSDSTFLGVSGVGAEGCTLNNCTVTSNSGCGAVESTLNDCVVSGNTGGGAYGGALNNCTVTGNSGWGASSAMVNNCIVYFNSDPNGGNYDAYSTLNYCCTTPLPTHGVGNLDADPQLASAWFLSAQSPCIGAGSPAYASGTDIDGERWTDPPSIGCEEYYAGTMTGPLTVSLTATFTNVATGFSVGLTAIIQGRTDLSVWDFGDGDVQVNEPYTSHAWTVPGNYLVSLWAYNDSYPGGVSATMTVHVAVDLHYVAANSGNPVAPYTSWATAATNIQNAVDVALTGATIFVTNGTYAAVAVNTALILRGVNGPGLTVIDGVGLAPCVWLTNDAEMVGFTLTNGLGYCGYGGGVYCSSTDAALSNCVLSGNSASGGGGGAYGGTLNNCTLTGNSGDGAAYSKLNNCTVTSNSGCGAVESTLNNCVVSGNTGGGAYNCTLNNCTITGNSWWGATSATLNNCIVYFNSAPNGGNYDPASTLNYCCTTPMPTTGVGNINADPQLASATYLSPNSPCIGAGCSTHVSGTDIDGEQWANPPSIGCDEYHAGTMTGPLTVAIVANYTNVTTSFPVTLTAIIQGRTDLSVWDFGDGDVAANEPYASHAWTAPGDYLVSLWAFNDSYPEGVSAKVSVHVELGLHYVAANSGTPVAPYTSWATAATDIQDAVGAALPGATIFVTNGTYATGGQVDPKYYFDVVVADEPLTIRSVNGPAVTAIDGGGTARGVYLANNAVLVGFTLTNGYGGAYCESTNAVLRNCVLTGNARGGAYGGTLNNCTLTGNSALDGFGGGAYWCTLNDCTLIGNSGYDGGGAAYCTLNNCTLTGNSAWDGGGGAEAGTLNNCTLTGNSATLGGGAHDCTLNNCIVYFNTATNWANCYQDQYGGVLNYCCTTPLPTSGVGNITNAPLFVNYTNGNLRLQSNSPCINSGNNAYVVGSTDLDGNPRIVGGTVDMGAYEYQTPTSIISYAWLQQYGLQTDGSADCADTDGTGMNNWQKWIAGLNPTNALSVLKMLAPSATYSPLGLVVSWQSVSNITYFLQLSTNLAAQPAFTTIQSNIVSQGRITSCTDTNAVGSGPFFYRVGVSQ